VNDEPSFLFILIHSCVHFYSTDSLQCYHESASYYYYILYTKLSLSNFSPLRNAFSCCPFKTLPITYLLTVYLFASNQHPYLHKNVFLERKKIAKELILPPFLNKARYLINFYLIKPLVFQNITPKITIIVTDKGHFFRCRKEIL